MTYEDQPFHSYMLGLVPDLVQVVQLTTLGSLASSVGLSNAADIISPDKLRRALTDDACD